MTHRRFSWVLGAFVLFAAWLGTGCETPETDPFDPRPCDIQNNNSTWSDFGFRGDVTEPEQCPVRLDSMFQTVPFSGFLAFGTIDEASGVTGFIKIEAIGGPIVSQPAQIDQGWFKDEPDNEWQANFSGEYIAGTNEISEDRGRDTAIFRTDISPTAQAPTDDLTPEVVAGGDLPWTQEMDMSVSGPSSVAIGDTLQLEADVHNGKPPYMYQWHHNGNPVGTNSPEYEWIVPSFTADGTHQFTVDVEDAEGDTGSYTTGVDVDGVDYGGGGGDQCLQDPCP